MQFVLRYHGPLPPREKRGRKAKPQEHGMTAHQAKNFIRFRLSKQLRQLWVIDKALATYPQQLPKIEKRGSSPFYRKPIAGIDFVPLVTVPSELRCELDLRVMRRDQPGRVLTRGDLDNRIKTLLDALAMPLQPTDVDKNYHVEDNGNDTCYCLLADDALVSRLHIETFDLLEPPKTNAEQSNIVVHFLVRVIPHPIIAARSA